MKRTLLGLTALTSVVGTGSVGVFYAHRIFVPAATAQSEPQELASEMNPVPIPLAATPVESAQSADDATGGNVPNTAPAVDNRYANYPSSPIQSPPVDETASVEPSPPAGGEDMPAAREGDPFAARHRGGARANRYPERPASAEAPDTPAVDETPAEDAATDNQDEPQQLADPQPGTVDRFGRRIPAAGDPRRREQPSNNSPFDRRGAVETAQDAGPQDGGDTESDNRVTEEPVVESQSPADDQPATDQGTGRPGDPQLSGSQGADADN